jgi:hypothetical protein
LQRIQDTKRQFCRYDLGRGGETQQTNKKETEMLSYKNEQNSDTTQSQDLRLALSNKPNRVGYFNPYPEEQSRSRFWNTVFFCVFQNTRWWTKSKNPVILTTINQYVRLRILWISFQWTPSSSKAYQILFFITWNI